MTDQLAHDPRRAELEQNQLALESRVAAACERAGRARDEVVVIAVTKTFPAQDVRRLAAIGVTDVGENRDQEAAPKQAACADLALRWHFIGRLQRNKCRSVVRYATAVHSVDSPALAVALAAAATGAGRPITALVQVNLDESPTGGRGGVAPAAVLELAHQISSADGLILGGVMAVAPLGADPDPAFERLGQVAANVRAIYPQATMLSAGMSGDLEAAVRHGATHLRVGSALLGHRRGPVG
jgi:PLP dependent protein